MRRVLSARMVLPRDPVAIQHALEGLVALDAYLIRKHRLPPLYESGATYRTEELEDWRSALEVVHEQWGDCEDLAAYRAAELRVFTGEPARLVLKRITPTLLHAVVRRANGTIEDPSRRLGM